MTAQPNGPEATLTVADDGRRIDPETLPKIYDPFFTTKRGAGGTGLGPHIVFNIVTDTLRGRIDCHSMPGRGTSFTVTIPLRIPQLCRLPVMVRSFPTPIRGERPILSSTF